jgi:hypothetical protein
MHRGHPTTSDQTADLGRRLEHDGDTITPALHALK